MLTLTENASMIVKDIASQSGAPEGGLRISVEPGADAAFSVAAAERAEPGDQVVEERGATVFVEEQAATALEDKVLDAGVDESGNVQFALGQQG